MLKGNKGRFIVETGPHKIYHEYTDEFMPKSSKVLMKLVSGEWFDHHIWLPDIDKDMFHDYWFQALYPQPTDILACRLHWINIIQLVYTSRTLEDGTVEQQAYEGMCRMSKLGRHRGTAMFTASDLKWAYEHSKPGDRLRKVMVDLAVGAKGHLHALQESAPTEFLEDVNTLMQRAKQEGAYALDSLQEDWVDIEAEHGTELLQRGWAGVQVEPGAEPRKIEDKPFPTRQPTNETFELLDDTWSESPAPPKPYRGHYSEDMCTLGLRVISLGTEDDRGDVSRAAPQPPLHQEQGLRPPVPVLNIGDEHQHAPSRPQPRISAPESEVFNPPVNAQLYKPWWENKPASGSLALTETRSPNLRLQPQPRSSNAMLRAQSLDPRF